MRDVPAKPAFLYVVTDTVTGQEYVGIALNPRDRWRNHRKAAGKKSPRQLLHRAMAKRGRDAFRMEVVACARTWEDGVALEVALIAQRRTFVEDGGYNLTRGGEGKPGALVSEETRAKIGATSAARRHTPETRAKIALGLAGRPCSEATREKRRQSMLGFRRGPPSAEHRAAISAGNTGKVRSEEVRKKDRAAAKQRWVDRRAKGWTPKRRIITSVT